MCLLKCLKQCFLNIKEKQRGASRMPQISFVHTPKLLSGVRLLQHFSLDLVKICLAIFM